MKGFIKGGIETTVQEVRIPKYAATKGTTDRVTFFKASTEKMITKTHYIPGVGTTYCWEGLCCKRFGEPKIRNVYPIIKYPSTKDGDLVLKGDPEILRLELSNKKDKSIKTKNKIEKDKGSDISKADMFIVGADDIQKIENSEGGKTTDYIDFTFEGPVEGPSYMKNKAWLQIIKDQWEFYKANIEKTYARTIETDEEYLEIISATKENNNTTSFQYSNNKSAKALPEQTDIVESTIIEGTADELFEEETKTNPKTVGVVDLKKDELDKLFDE